MADFYQNGIVSSLHNFNHNNDKVLETELETILQDQPMELILPCLYSELEGEALKDIIEKINKLNFLNHVIIGLDRANEKEFLFAKKYFSKLNVQHSILWNDGSRLRKLQKILNQEGIADVEDGKGKNVWYCIGYAISRNTAEAIAFHDCDIKTYHENILIRLFYPLVSRSMGYSFSKGYYPRYADNKLNGRVTRLLVTPLVKSLIMLFGKNEYLEFIDSFKYPLAGEYAFKKHLLREIRIPSDWGLEIGILSELQRNYSSKLCCQVDLADQYDHKHQFLSEDDDSKGLSRMTIDITKAFLRKMATQGNTFNEESFRTLKATYYRKALEYIDIYKNDAKMNGLNLDINLEEKTVEIFAENIIKAGKVFLSQPMEKPFIPSWQRVEYAAPGFLTKLRRAVVEDNQYSNE